MDTPSGTTQEEGLTSASSPLLVLPSIEKRPLLDRWAERAGSTAELSDATKAYFVQILMTVASAVYGLAVVALDGWPFFDGSVAPVVAESVPWTLSMWLIWPLLMLFTWPAHRRGDRSPQPIMVHLTAAFYALNIGFFSYLTGPFRATSGFALFGGLMTGMILFQHSVLFAGLFVYISGLLSIAYLSHLGALPFEPLYLNSVGTRGLDPDWLLRSTISMVALGLIVFPVLGLIVESWRYRERRLERAARVDALTGIFNRRYTMEALDHAFGRATKRRPLSVVMVDVDHFKTVNDRFGHLVGDQVLREVAKTLESCLRRTDTLGRYGGEEFLLVLPKVPHESARLVAERCRQSIAELALVSTDGVPFAITASFGVATVPPHHPTVEALLDVADAALYDAKRGGRNSVVSDRASLTPEVTPA